jgi:hypothetical protein
MKAKAISEKLTGLQQAIQSLKDPIADVMHKACLLLDWGENADWTTYGNDNYRFPGQGIHLKQVRSGFNPLLIRKFTVYGNKIFWL